MKKIFYTLFLFLFLVANAEDVLGRRTPDKIFRGSEDNQWSNPNNWDPPGVPGFNDNVLVPQGAMINAEGTSIEANQLINNGHIDSPDNIQVANNFFNNNNGEVNNAQNIEAGGLFNKGIIQGKENNALKIVSKNPSVGIFNDDNGIINAPGPEGVLNMQNANGELQNFGKILAGKVIMLLFNRIVNQEGAEIKAGENLYLYGDVSNLSEIGTSDEVGENLFGGQVEITAINKEGNSMVDNQGTIRGGNGAEGFGGDNVFIYSDEMRQAGSIIPGMKGEGQFIFDGYSQLVSRLINVDPSAYFFAQRSSVTFSGNQIYFQPLPPNAFHKTQGHPEPIIDAEGIWIQGHQIYFNDLHPNSLSAEFFFRIENSNRDNSYMDFSGLTEGPVFHTGEDGTIEIHSRNVIPPAIGLESLFSGNYQISEQGFSASDYTMVVPPAISNQDNSDSLWVFIRNEHTVARSFEYSIASEKGWVRPIESETSVLEPWESEAINVIFDIPPDLSEVTQDTLMLDILVFGTRWQQKSNIITGLPIDASSTPLETPLPLCGPITLLHPQNHASNDISPTFSWNSNENAVLYRFEIARDELFNEPIGEPIDFLDTIFTYQEILQDHEIYFWRVRGDNYSGPGEWSEVFRFYTSICNLAECSTLSNTFVLSQNYPNPFNPVTTISYSLPVSEYVEMHIYNVAGQLVAVLVQAYQDAGHHIVSFDGSAYASGLYFYQLKAGDFTDTRHMMLIK